MINLIKSKINALRKYFLENIFPLLLVLVSLTLNSCSEDDDGLGQYYEGSYVDEIFLEVKKDTAYVILEQLGIAPTIKEIVPYLIVDIPTLSDTINLDLMVSFGSYSQNPKVIKEVRESEDSVYIWYSTRSRNLKLLHKNSNVLGIETSPEIEYVSVDSVVIYKPVNKSVGFFSRRF